MRRRHATLAAVLVFAACGSDTAQDQTSAATEAAANDAAAARTQLVAQIRSATEKYQDLGVAERDGYIPDPTGTCVSAAMVGLPESAGSMGLHYLRPDLLGITAPTPPLSGTDGIIDVAQPEVLVYEPQADGSMQLVAAEYLVVQVAWRAAGNTAPPTLAGEPFVPMVDDPATAMDEAHGFTPHYELHVWLYRDNPTGLFAEFNPNVSCAHGSTGMQM